MELTKERIIDLLMKQLEGTLSEEESRELRQWSALSDENKAIMSDFLNQHAFEAGLKKMYETRKRIWDDLEYQISVKRTADVRPSFRARHIAAAAAVLILFTVCGYLYYGNISTTSSVTEVKIVQNDILPPGSSRAYLVLDEGDVISLDSLSTSSSPAVRNIRKHRDQVIYAGVATREIFHTLVNPRGSKPITLNLADGTKVWLNSESSIRYPVSFIRNDRRVRMKGEVYFEVAKQKNMPFVVENNDAIVEVLGTHFNVNSFEDSEQKAVTLLEGKVKVNYKSAFVELEPGQQARIGNSIQVKKEVDVANVMAWKSEMFVFKGLGIKPILNQIARWYDLEVEYRTNEQSNEKFYCEISRNTNVSNVIKILKATGGVQMKIEGRKIIVE